MLENDKKQTTIKKFQLHSEDTGSPEVQIALLTERISALTNHLKAHKKDKHSRRSLLIIVARRKKLLDYLSGKSTARYKKIAQSLRLRTS